MSPQNNFFHIQELWQHTYWIGILFAKVYLTVNQKLSNVLPNIRFQQKLHKTDHDRISQFTCFRWSGLERKLIIWLFASSYSSFAFLQPFYLSILPNAKKLVHKSFTVLLKLATVTGIAKKTSSCHFQTYPTPNASEAGLWPVYSGDWELSTKENVIKIYTMGNGNAMESARRWRCTDALMNVSLMLQFPASENWKLQRLNMEKVHFIIASKRICWRGIALWKKRYAKGTISSEEPKNYPHPHPSPPKSLLELIIWPNKRYLCFRIEIYRRHMC